MHVLTGQIAFGIHYGQHDGDLTVSLPLQSTRQGLTSEFNAAESRVMQ